MFRKILIANRGEIACRIIRTARRLGIATVAVYSDADRDARHVREADESVRIGPAPAAQSYLDEKVIIDAARESGAEAVHPGYGFLSENAGFAEALEKANIVFIGPPAPAITAMGDKITSKRLAAEAGVSTIPGHPEAIADVDEAVRVAAEIGYPVMLKASAGGGGKGMRIVSDDASCREGFERARSEARSSFGDERLLIEKYISHPRHIEIQVLADAHGRVIHLGERECSIQRRHQKVIEESPSPFLDPATRAAMGEQAVTLAKAVGYQSAGTVEFVVDADRKFYFLEMNTRLQVEHPVTEFVTGLDLVEWMIRIAAGEKLKRSQDAVAQRGWAIEARIYAEDPFRNFLPSVGRLVRYRTPATHDGVRIDSGVDEGGEVSMFYDPLLAKLVSFGDTRAAAMEHMRDALDGFYIDGVLHNISFLQAVMNHPRFVAGDITTTFIEEEYPHGFHPADVAHPRPELPIVAAAAIHRRYEERATRINGQMPGREHAPNGSWIVIVNGENHEVVIRSVAGGHDVIHRNMTYTVLSEWRFGDPLFRANINAVPVCMQLQRRGGGVYRLYHRGCQIDARVVSPGAARLNVHMIEKAPPDLSKYLLSPMPGLLLELRVEAGQEVKTGEELAIVEAMKMENVLRATRDARVEAVLATPGASLTVDQAILEFA